MASSRSRRSSASARASWSASRRSSTSARRCWRKSCRSESPAARTASSRRRSRQRSGALLEQRHDLLAGPNLLGLGQLLGLQRRAAPPPARPPATAPAPADLGTSPAPAATTSASPASSRRSACARASCSEAAANRASVTSSRRASSASASRAACAATRAAARRIEAPAELGARPPRPWPGPLRARHPSPRCRARRRASRAAPNRSPARVTTMAPGWASAASRARGPPPSTTTAAPSSPSSSRADVGLAARDVAAQGSPDGGGDARRQRRAEGQHGTRPAAGVEEVEGAPGGSTPGDHHGGQRLARSGLEGDLPAVVDLDEVEQRADHAVDVAPAARRRHGPGPGRARGPAPRPVPPTCRERPSAAWRARSPALTASSASARRCSAAASSATRGSSSSSAASHSPRRRSASAVEPLERARRGRPGAWPSRAGLGHGPVDGRPAACAARPAPRPRAPAGRRRRAVVAVAHRLAVGGQHRLVGRPPRAGPVRARARESPTSASSARSRAASASRVATMLVSSRRPTSRSVARRRSLDDRRQAPGPLPQLLDPADSVGQVGAAHGREPRLGRQHLGVEAGQRGPQLALGGGGRGLVGGQRREPGLQRGDLAAGEEQPQAVELGHQVAVAAGGLGLALQRPQLAPDLAQEVLQPQRGCPPWPPAGARPSPCACGTSGRRRPPR